jgi:hypothetical protein
MSRYIPQRGGLSCEGAPEAAATEETGNDRPAAPSSIARTVTERFRDFLREYVPGVIAWPFAFLWLAVMWAALPPERFKEWRYSL